MEKAHLGSLPHQLERRAAGLHDACRHDFRVMDEDDPITITVRCRVTGCGYQKTYLPENPSDLLSVLKDEGWRFAQKGKRTLPVCQKHYK